MSAPIPESMQALRFHNVPQRGARKHVLIPR
jgi:hypothetical protein